MTNRSPPLQTFLDELGRCLGAAHCEGRARAVAHALIAATRRPAPAGSAPPADLPVCRHLPAAISLGKAAPAPVDRLASAFEGIAPRLTWKIRASGGPFASENWPAGHANALIVGEQDSLEVRGDIAIGVSLLAPEVRYPDHNHRPEELYMLLTPGRFQHGDADWVALAPGETFHNDPDIRHAMASGSGPLLAVWCLLLDEQLAGPQQT
jgi:hypothetical protein